MELNKRDIKIVRGTTSRFKTLSIRCRTLDLI
ncbi:hypothetical protein [Candidiatus Paracoxiella cheracis]